MKFHIHLDPAFECKLDRLLSALLTQGEIIMSAISDFAAKQTAFNTDLSNQLDALQTDITALNTKITTLQNSPGQISAADQATLDSLVTAGTALQAKADALATMEAPTPPAA
jgi:hypothetical protein